MNSILIYLNEMTAREILDSRKRFRQKSTIPKSGGIQLTKAIPFAGTKVLDFTFNHRGVTEPKIHHVNIRFLKVNIKRKESKNDIESLLNVIIPYKGIDYLIENNLKNKDVQIKCTCSDFVHIWAWADSTHPAKYGGYNPKPVILWGNRPKKYKSNVENSPHNPEFTPPPLKNSEYTPGMCKHIYNSFIYLENKYKFKIL